MMYELRFTGRDDARPYRTFEAVNDDEAVSVAACIIAGRPCDGYVLLQVTARCVAYYNAEVTCECSGR